MMYNDYGSWLTEQLGTKVQKISLNAGFTCPNRDGRVGTGGCTYCNNQTFNPGYCAPTKSITQQLEEGKQFFARKYPTMKYLAYFQAYTNTYDSLDRLKAKYEEALSVSDVVGLIIGTRPDCMPPALLDYLTTLKFHQLQFIRGTRMAEEYAACPADFHLFTVNEYIDLIIDIVERLRPDLVLERFVSQSPASLLAVPGWGLKNHEFVAQLRHRMEEKGACQGRLFTPPAFPASSQTSPQTPVFPALR